ncbi:MAG: hypothetical protein APF76_07490 [Desulfitibacter sp. BRH_c19]|nr:MAG: hypothetical protein APF76_07490 [Desulfitibacter sp. BRH_c19]
MLYSFAKAIFLFIFKYLCRWQVEGVENIPQKGPVVLIANHTSYWDPIALGVVSSRRVSFMAKAELFKIPVLSQIVKGLGAFPVDRQKSDRAALRAALDILDKGDVVGMFPEGTRIRDEELGEFKMGATMIAAKANAPIIPIALINTPKIFSKGFFRSFKVIVQKPIYIEKNEAQKVTSKQLEQITNDIRQQILSILQEFKDF